MYRGTKIKNGKTSHQKQCESEKDGATFFKVLKEKKAYQLRTLTMKITFKNEGGIKTFSNIQKLKEFYQQQT